MDLGEVIRILLKSLIVNFERRPWRSTRRKKINENTILVISWRLSKRPTRGPASVVRTRKQRP